MKKKHLDEDPLDREIDFTNARPNPHFLAAVGPKRVRVLDEDLIDLFPDNASVNEALRMIADAARRSGAAKRLSARRAAASRPARRKAR